MKKKIKLELEICANNVQDICRIAQNFSNFLFVTNLTSPRQLVNFSESTSDDTATVKCKILPIEETEKKND